MPPLTIKEVIMGLVFTNPSWKTDDILSELEALGYVDLPTRFLVSSVRSSFRTNLRFLIERGLVDADACPKGGSAPERRRKNRQPDPDHQPSASLHSALKPRPRKQLKEAGSASPKRYRRHFYCSKDD
jgi:hypothetical protein